MCTDGTSRRRFIAMVPGLAIAVSGCLGDGGTGVVEVKWGREYCEYCGMIIDDRRFAAQVRGGKDRKAHKFDDLGDAALWLAKQDWAEQADTEFWVGHAETGVWLDGRKAFYHTGYKSPMAHNFGALPEARDGGLSFAQFRQALIDNRTGSRCEPTAEHRS